MQNLEDLKEKIFFEAKNILDNLAKISSLEELLMRKDLIEELNERISFLKILEKNEDLLVFASPSEDSDIQNLNEVSGILNPDLETHEILEEEVLFTNELNEEIHKTEDEKEIFQFAKSDEIHIDFAEDIERVEQTESNVAQSPENNTENTAEESEEDYQKLIAEKERAFQELEERRRKIVDFQKPEVKHNPEISEDEKPEYLKHSEAAEQAKKFKIPHIKGLKTVQSLFDDDPLEKFQEENYADETTALPASEQQPAETGSLMKNNMPTDFMEAEKQKQGFRLDLNDKIAFSKMLFNGSQTELNEAVKKLNEFKNLEDAKEFLSDLYYEKNWKNSDEYAQRLWSLVENKFQ